MVAQVIQLGKNQLLIYQQPATQRYARAIGNQNFFQAVKFLAQM
jgi:hypothetical protein